MKTLALLLTALLPVTDAAIQYQTKPALAGQSIVYQQQNSSVPMKNQATQVVSTFLKAVQTGDQATLAASLHGNIEWNQPGTNAFSGIKRSKEAVFQMVGGMFSLTENTMRLTDIKVLAENGNEIACLLHWTAARPTGEVLAVDNIDVYTVKDGQIIKAQVFSADIEQENRFWVR